jgi:hypothetical protein
MISGTDAFAQVLADLAPLFASRNFRLREGAEHSQAFGSRYAVFEDPSCQIRLVWDGKEQWFVLEADEKPGQTEWPGWADITLQRYDPRTGTQAVVNEIAGDVRAALADYLGDDATGKSGQAAV